MAALEPINQRQLGSFEIIIDILPELSVKNAIPAQSYVLFAAGQY